MKQVLYILLILALVGGFTAAGGGRAEAMNNEAAAMLGGAIALFGWPIINAVAHPEPVYYYDGYYPERARVVYVAPHHRHDRYCGHDRDRRWRGHRSLYGYDRGYYRRGY